MRDDLLIDDDALLDRIAAGDRAGAREILVRAVAGLIEDLQAGLLPLLENHPDRERLVEQMDAARRRFETATADATARLLPN